MDKLRFILLFAVVLLTGRAAAYDFASGGFYYNILDAGAKTVEVTNQNGTEKVKVEGYTGRIVIPATVTNNGVEYQVVQIGKFAFYNSDIETLVISEGVESIQEGAFYWCFSLKEVSFPKSLRTVGRIAFWNCSSLGSIEFQEGLTTIENQAFGYSYNVVKIVLPSTVKSIEYSAFRNMESLNTVISYIAEPFEIPSSVFAMGENYDETTQTTTYFPSAATLYVPVGSKSAYEALEGWNMFAGIYEGEPKEAYKDGLNFSYTEGANVAKLIAGDYSSMEEIVIPGSVVIDDKTYIVKEIGARVFSNLDNLKSVVIEDGVEVIDNQAFWDCDNINNLVLPSTLKSIGSDAFTWIKVKNLEFPEGMLSIGSGAFRNCNNLQKVVLPSTLTSLGDGLFRACNSLSSVVSRITTPFDINPGTFAVSENWIDSIQKTEYDKCTAILYVPVGSLAQYQAIEGWTMFADIVEGELKEETVNGLRYSYSESKYTASVIAGDYADMGNLTIPGSVTINGISYQVKSISASAFERADIDTLIIEDGVETVGKYAFRYNNNMRSVKLPSTLKSIDIEGFWNCGMTELDIPEGVETIGNRAFQGCYKLRKLTLPSTITSIGHWAFIDLNNLNIIVSRMTDPVNIEEGDIASYGEWNNDEEKYYYTYCNATLYVPNGTTAKYQAIPGWSVYTDIVEGEPAETTIDGLKYFYISEKTDAKLISGNYSEMESVTIPGTIVINGVTYTVKEIGAYAFEGCKNLKSLVVQDGVEIIAERAFSNCSILTSIQLPTSLRSIGQWAFYNCYNSPELVLPEGLEVIEDNAFYWTNSRSIVLPSTLKSIGQKAFYHVNNNVKVKSNIKEPFAINQNTFAREIYYDANNNEVCNSLEGTLHVPVGSLEMYQALAGWLIIGEVMEGEPVEGVGDDGFKYSYVPETKKATLIRGDGYYNLRNISIPSSTTIDGITCQVIGIGDNAFSNTYLNSVKIANSVLSIGKNAFRSCQELRSIILPESITKIGDEAFEWCNALDTISIPKNVQSIGRSAYAGTRIIELVIPASTTYIGDYAFGDCRQVTSISVDAANGYYDSRNNCNALIETATNKLMKGCATTVIPNGIIEIGPSAFSGCRGLTNASIPNSVTTIWSGAFNDCDGLTSVFIPSSVTLIGTGAYTNCDGLTSVKVDVNNSVYDSRNNCNAIIETSSNTLITGCKETVIPHGVKSIANSAFNCVNGMDSIRIPYGVESIEGYAFSYCNDLKYIEIPNSVKHFGNYLFEGDYSLTTIVAKIKNPSESDINYDAFNDSGVQSSATLYVPKGKKDAYMNAGNNWSGFQNIVEMDGNPAPTPTLSYDGRYVTATCADNDVDMYYSTGDDEPSSHYDGPIAVHDLGKVRVLAEKSFASDSEIAEYTVEYLYDGDTLKLSKAGMMADAIKWCGNDKVEKMTVVGPISSTEFETIRSLSNLKFLNLEAANSDSPLVIPDNAFANTNLVSFVAPTTLASVGSGIFSGCSQLAAVCWDNTDKPLPSDALNGVDNPNLLLYISNTATAPEGIRNVIRGGSAEKIYLSDAEGNNNFYCPVEFTADSIFYTRNFKQKTEVGVSCGWETIVLPFDVQQFSHEKFEGAYYTMVPFAAYNGWDNQRPFWLYRLENNNISPAYNIEANVPYLICMPNADDYGDQYNLNGNVTFIGVGTTIPVSTPHIMTQNDVSFAPTYQRIEKSEDVFTLNVNEEYKGYPAGSLFVSNFREVRPFEAYSVHPSQAKAAGARMITVSSLIGGGDDTTGIIDMMLKKNESKADTDAVIKVYSLSGALVKQGRADEVTKSLPKGIYIANGKKFVVK